MRNPVKAIKEVTGMTIEQYCVTVLKTSYKSFSYRIRKGALRLEEYKQIIADTGATFDELFGGVISQVPGSTSEPTEPPREPVDPKTKQPVEQKTDPEPEYIDTFQDYKPLE